MQMSNEKGTKIMDEIRLLKLEETIENNREHMWLQMRYWPKAEPVAFTYEHTPWLIFRSWGTEERIRVEVKPEEYGKSWRCFNIWPADQENRFRWGDGQGSWTFEEDPEG